MILLYRSRGGDRYVAQFLRDDGHVALIGDWAESSNEAIENLFEVVFSSYYDSATETLTEVQLNHVQEEPRSWYCC